MCPGSKTATTNHYIVLNCYAYTSNILRVKRLRFTMTCFRSLRKYVAREYWPDIQDAGWGRAFPWLRGLHAQSLVDIINGQSAYEVVAHWVVVMVAGSSLQ